MGAKPPDEPRERIEHKLVLVRVNCPVSGGPVHLSGLVERIGTGEKRPFSSGTELIELMTELTGGPSARPKA